jgi:adenylate cyclase
VLDFAVPLEFSQVPVGAIYLGFSQQSMEAALGRARDQAVLVTVVMVFLGLAGAIALSRVLSRPIFRLVEGTRAIAAGDFHVTLQVPSRDELGVLTESFNQMARNLREKEMIKRAFTRYVAREVVEEILKDPEHLVLSGERREVTVVFCDVRGFTPLSERLTPEEVVALLNDFYTLMIEITFKHDGTLDKFLGDAVMAVFGAPIAHPDHSIRAVRTALAMQDGLLTLNERRVALGKVPITAGIGISAGEAVAGTVGTEDRMEYTVVGDSVNLAARLESHAKAGEVLISERTYEKVRDLVEARPLGPFRVKGKEDEVQVYQVLGLNSAG